MVDGQPQRPPLHRRELLALAVVSLAAFALRTFRLDGQSLWYDEGVTASVAARGLAELTHWTAGDIQPPLYYYLVAGWAQLAGWSEWSLRFPSVFFGVLAAPLLAVTAYRLTRHTAAARLAALLVALHPMLIYYSQEARMYALLLALGVLAGYLLLRSALPAAGVRARPLLPWIAYVLVAAAAVYTHYFAFFLLAGLGFGVAFVAGVRRDWRTLLALLAANLLVLLLYLPWLTVMWQQLGADRSYWTGLFKPGAALQAVALSFTSGVTVIESTASWLLLGYAVVTLFALATLWRTPGRGRRTLIFALCWLLTPVVAVLTLASLLPKFNVRYVMVALPGLLLIWAAGLALLRPGPGRRVSPILAPLLTSLLLLGFTYAGANWYFHPNFAKDDWRGLAQWLRARITPEELVVLVSGHAWPVWAYYAPDLPAVRLPEIEILDVDAVLTFEDTGPALRAAFAEGTGKDSAWLINWQDEVVDPNGIVPVQLEMGGREKGQSVTFAGLDLRRYTGIRPGRIAVAPPIDHAIAATASDRVTLAGYKTSNNGDLLLFWRLADVGAAGPGDLRMALTSYQDGAQLAQPPDRRLAGYTYAAERWQPGVIVTGVVLAQDWLGTEPESGRYDVVLRVYDGNDATAAPLRWDDGRAELRLEGIDVIVD